MANLLNSGYLGSLTAVVFSGTQVLNSLTNDEWTSLSDEIDNTSNKYPYYDLELILGSAAFTGVDAGLEIYIIPTIDGTNYPDWTDNTTSDAPENIQYYAAWMPIKASTSTKRIATPPDGPVAVPQGKFKFGIRNRGNVTLAASGNTLSWYARTYAI